VAHLRFLHLLLHSWEISAVIGTLENKELGSKVLDHITRHPEEHSQATWNFCVYGWAIRIADREKMFPNLEVDYLPLPSLRVGDTAFSYTVPQFDAVRWTGEDYHNLDSAIVGVASKILGTDREAHRICIEFFNETAVEKLRELVNA
jgi:hypothetical protein